MVTAFWVAIILILAAIDIAAYLMPGDDSFSATVRRWTVKYPWIRLTYLVLAVVLYVHLWGFQLP